MKYILVQWPESQMLMEHERFHECLLIQDIEGHNEVGSSAYMCPEDLWDEIFSEKILNIRQLNFWNKLEKRTRSEICKHMSVEEFFSYLDAEDTLDKALKSTKRKLQIIYVLKNVSLERKTEEARKALVKANQEYGNSYNEFEDDCQEFNVPNI